MRLVSTAESVEKGEPTWLAVMETVLAVVCCWGAAWYFESHLHLWISILVAPLLLLRSPESIHKGTMWFAAYLADKTKITPRGTPIRFWGILLPLVLGITVVCAYAMTQSFLVDHGGWSLFLRSMLVGIIAVWVVVAVAVAGAMAGSVVLALTIAFVLALALAVADVAALAVALGLTVTLSSFAAIMVVLALVGAVAGTGDLTVAVLLAGIPWLTGIWLRSLGIRIVATLRHPLLGLRALPYNWQRILWVIDAKHSPELLPGPGSLASAVSPQNIRGLIHARGMLKRFFGIVLFSSFLLPALLYRWGIKSTFWFYWPLLYLHSKPQQQDAETSKICLLNLYKGSMERSRQWLALILLLCMSATTYFMDIKVFIQSHVATVPARLYLETFDLSLWAPWQWCSVTTILLTVLIYAYGYAVFTIQNQWMKKKDALHDTAYHSWGLFCLMRMRNISTIAFLFLTGGYTGLVLQNISLQQLPDWLAILKEIYGPYLS